MKLDHYTFLYKPLDTVTRVTYHPGELALEVLVALLDLLGHQFELVPLLATLVQVSAQDQQGLTLGLEFSSTDGILKRDKNGNLGHP